MPLRVLFPRVRVEELLHLRHSGVRFGAEAQLDLHQGLEAGVEVRYAQIDELRQFGEELLVECFVGGAGEIGFAFCARKFRGVLVGFFHELFDAGAGGVVIEELVVAFFDACRQYPVLVGEEAWRSGGRRSEGETKDEHSLMSGK